jgi:hypothetical protein
MSQDDELRAGPGRRRGGARIWALLAVALPAACGTESIELFPVDGGPVGGSGGGSGGAVPGTGASPPGTAQSGGNAGWGEQPPPPDHATGGAPPVVYMGVGEECGDRFLCEPLLTCDPYTRICVPICDDDRDCYEPRPECYIDDARKGRCVECTDDSHCEDNPGRNYCLSYAGVCVECLDDAQCPPEHPVCHDLFFRCEKCQTQEDCDPGEYCDEFWFECVPID